MADDDSFSDAFWGFGCGALTVVLLFLVIVLILILGTWRHWF